MLGLTPYIGRFAPSPTGPLHFGSLVSALASFLDARANHGKWFVRMEDLGPPREQAGAAISILQCLEDYQLYWDGDVIYQSQRSHIYNDYLAHLAALDLLYRCDCTRQDLQAMNGTYNGHCRTRNIDTSQPHALRLKLYDLPKALNKHLSDELTFIDLIQGPQTQNLRTQSGDQILKRKDGFFAYQLAVVADDIEQNISHIIRGSDLLEVTARQIFMYRLLDAPTPQFGHVTLATHSTGQKLSKQNMAPALKTEEASRNIWHALAFLRQNPPQELYTAATADLLAWAIAHWRISNIKELSSPI